MPTNDFLLVGAGGHAAVVLDALFAGMPGAAVEVRDDNLKLTGSSLLGCVVQTPSLRSGIAGMSVHVAIGAGTIRQRLARAAVAAGAEYCAIVHPSATVSPFAKIGEGVFIAANAIVGPRTILGEGVIVNHGATVDHDCQVAAWCHLAPRVVLGGGVTVGELALVGAGSVILPGLKIGDGAVIGAGAVVTRDVAAGRTVVGIPARETDG